MEKVKIGIIGCGNISPIYFKNCIEVFEILEVKACADIVFERAKAKAEEYGIKAYTVEDMLNDDEIEIILNLTTPNAHFSVCDAALDAGKSVHTEKPLSVLFEEGKALVKKANEKKLLLGAAPDTFLGAGIQTCRKLIDDGWIGQPIGATAFMLCPGHESWHPAPQFYYKKGGGPMFDMGPYYLTALVNLLGPVESVAGSVSMTRKQRIITSKPLAGTVMDVEVPTHVTGLLNFKNGAIGTIVTSFDVFGGNVPFIEIYGTEGSLSVPDPNVFGGPVKVKIRRNEWTEVPLTHMYRDNSRGIGVADMAYALKTGRKNRCSGELACHVLEIMHGIHIASDTKSNYVLETTCERPQPLPSNPMHGRLE
ncbi:MAG: Gfo/Idh/MocA family protein [Clostridia bacterium]|jgi:predicted dehydrogenase